MRKGIYITPSSEIVMALTEHSLLTDSDKKYIQSTEEVEEVTGVELGGNTNHLWDDEN